MACENNQLSDDGKARHRGADPRDAGLFGEAWAAVLREAAGDLAWLLGRGYSEKSGLKLVGDRYALRQRQRQALMRGVCTAAAGQARRAKRVRAAALRGEVVAIDGYNVVTTLETALGGGVLVRGLDGCWRDVAELHGSYRPVAETEGALERVGVYLAGAGVKEVRWYLDRPVSNSGRLKGWMEALAGRRGWEWEVALEYNPDRMLIEADEIVVSSDSVVLDGCGRWFDLVGELIEGLDGVWRVDLG